MSSTGDNTATTAASPNVDHSSSMDPKIVAGASETETSQVPPPPTFETKVSTKSSRSWVWEHYAVVTGTETKDKKAACKYCQQLIACASKNGTTSLSNHLHRCKKYPYNNMDKRQKTLEFKEKEGGGKALTTHMFDQESCRRMLARMVIIDELPFKFVEREGFLDFCQFMQPRFEMPSRRTLTRDCHKLFSDEKKSLKAYFETLSSRICLTTDAWTSIQNLNYLCLTAHFIDDKWKLHKKILSFCPITSHVGEVIGQTVEKCLLDWKISKVLTVTVDNASSNDTCLQYLRRRLINWKGTVLNGEYLHMRCAAHVLNLTVREGLKDLEDSIVRIRSAVRYVRSSPARAQRFKSCIEKERIESKSLVCLDVETRWNSTFLMLEAALKFQKAFELLETVDSKYVEELTLQSENDTRRSSKVRGVPTEMDWEYAKDLLPFLQIFYDSTVKMSGSRYVTGNVYMNEIFGIGGLLNSFQESDDFGLSTMAGNMKKKYDKYWGNVERINILILIAVVLDPRHKLSYVQWAIDEAYDPKNAEMLKVKVEKVLHSLFDFYSAEKSPHKEVISQNQLREMDKMDVDAITVKGASDYMHAKYSQKADTLDSTHNKTELDIYLMEMKEDFHCPNFHILDWWRDNAHRFQILAAIARDVLAIPVSTVASESAFSTGGRVLDSFRSSLTPRMVEAIICGQDWLRKGIQPIDLEESITELEEMESGLTMEHSIINIED